MKQIKLMAKELKKMKDPNLPDSEHIKYVCYVQAKSIPQELEQWMKTNPREQKMTTNVANKIKNSLINNPNFHELNRGIVISAEEVSWNNRTKELVISLHNVKVHGNIDGGHTLRAILEAKSTNLLPENRYVFMEIIVGLKSSVELAVARNTSVQLDLKSIVELENNFNILKEAFDKLAFSNRIQYKMNEHYNSEISEIDVREIIAIMIMFSQEIYPYKTEQNILSQIQPIQCYSDKEASLRKFLICNTTRENHQKKNRELMVKKMNSIIPDIFELWETVETTFAIVSKSIERKYGMRKYSKYNGTVVGESLFNQKQLYYIIPKGIIYPIVGAFRALVQINKDTGEYYWRKPPMDVWMVLREKLVMIVLDEKADDPEVLAKNKNLWSNLFKEVYVYACMN